MKTQRVYKEYWENIPRNQNEKTILKDPSEKKLHVRKGDKNPVLCWLVVLADTEDHLQILLFQFYKTAITFNMTISTAKNKQLYFKSAN